MENFSKQHLIHALEHNIEILKGLSEKHHEFKAESISEDGMYGINYLIIPTSEFDYEDEDKVVYRKIKRD